MYKSSKSYVYYQLTDPVNRKHLSHYIRISQHINPTLKIPGNFLLPGYQVLYIAPRVVRSFFPQFLANPTSHQAKVTLVHNIPYKQKEPQNVETSFYFLAKSSICISPISMAAWSTTPNRSAIITLTDTWLYIVL